MTKNNLKMIGISEQNYRILSSLGTVSDTYDSVVTRLLSVALPILQKKEQS